MRKLATMVAFGILAFAGLSFATDPTIYRAPVYMDWTLGGMSTGSTGQGPYGTVVGVDIDTFTSAHGQFKDTWVLKRTMYDVVLYTDSATKQVGAWIGAGGAVPYVTVKDSTALFIPGKVDTIFTYRLAADTAGSEVMFVTGRKRPRDNAVKQW